MDQSKDLDDNVNVFNKLVQDIVNCGEKVSEEYKAIILFNSIPEIYKEVKMQLSMIGTLLTPETVIDSLRSKAMEMKAEKHDKKSGEIHMMRGRTQFRQTGSQEYQCSGESSNNGGKKKGKSWSRSKSRVKAKKYYGCGNIGHFIKDCHKAKNKQTDKERDEVNVMSSSNSDQGEVYVLINSVVGTAELDLTAKSCLHECVLDSGASFHVKTQIQQPEEEDEEVVIEDHPVEEEPLVDYQFARDRERRQAREPRRFGYESELAFAYASYEELVDRESNTFEEAMRSEQSEEWLKAMREEMSSLAKNQTWELVPRPKNKSTVDCKWIFKVKEGTSTAKPLKFKARLVAKGYRQKDGVDYNEIFSHVVKYTTIRVMLALVAYFDWELEQLNVKTAFLHGELDEQIFMNQPKGECAKEERQGSATSLFKSSLAPRWRFVGYLLPNNLKRL
ncbi:putative gag-pol polyprotein [Abeliophyllum distichum]|uniref:Gag-pol polyprotein n=1 Tax=Abeliophyllum distichum TaxID=126358 RepID=A0ABD1SYQ0_9LAMI